MSAAVVAAYRVWAAREEEDVTPQSMRAYQAGRCAAQAEGGALAMRVLQSDLYRQLDDTERAECDELIEAHLATLRSRPRKCINYGTADDPKWTPPPLMQLEYGNQFATNRGFAVTREWIRGFDAAIDYVRAALQATGERYVP